MKFPSIRNKIIIFIVLLLILGWTSYSLSTGFITFASTRYINRDISQDTVAPDEEVSIILDVGILADDRFYIIDELIPSGWTIVNSGDFVDAGTLNASESGHLKIVVIQDVSDISYIYTIKAPLSEGDYSFVGGVYQIEGVNESQPIGGETSITVKQPIQPEICNGIDDDLDTYIDEGCDDDNDDYCDTGMTREGLYFCDNPGDWCCNVGGGDCDDSPITGYYINPGSNVYCDCNPITGGGATTGTTEICGDEIDQDCNGEDLPCCDITGAAWNESQVEDGQAVTLSVNGSEICGDGEIVILELWELDTNTNEKVTSIDLGTMTLIGDYASKEWNAMWIRDMGDATSDPEYFFKAILQSDPLAYNVSDTLRVITDDEDNDGVHDDIDCNNNDTKIGECTGCAACSDPEGYLGTCVDGGACPDITCQSLCGYGTCNIDEIPQFKSPTEPSVCEITGDYGQCATDCVNYNCTHDADCDIDDDNDGVPDVDDKCPNTSPSDAEIVNKYGCPKPTATKFTPDLTTDFNEVDLLNIIDMTLAITNLGKILFIGNTTLLSNIAIQAKPVDLDSHISIEKAKVSVDSSVLTMLNKSSIITMFYLEIQYPIIWKDSEICLDCIIIEPEFYSENLSFSVSGFTEYSVTESECGDSYCYEALENCSSCPQDCGECPIQCTDQDDDGYNGTGVDCNSTAPDFDCNDTDSEVNPGMTEIVYNGKDDDCNTITRDTDLDGDENLPIFQGGTDCNDSNANIGQCEGCAICSDSTGKNGMCQANDTMCPPIVCPTELECGYGGCNSSSVALFDDPTEPTNCSVAGDVGTCSPYECQNYRCVYIIGCEMDSDNDTVPDLTDRCPNTSVADWAFVNRYGCPVPVYTRFTPDLTTNFSNVGLINITNMTLGITNLGQIKFIENTTIMEYSLLDVRYTRVNLDENVNISHNFVSMNSSALEMLNKSAIIKLFNLTFTRPVILRNDRLCGELCQIIQYLGEIYKNLTFSVAGFTDYSTREHFCGDGRCDDDIDESCSNCVADCGSCPLPPPSLPPPSSPTCGDRPIQPCPTAVWEDYPVCEWNTSQCVDATIVCTVDEMRCLSNYLQRCEIHSTPWWYTLELCEYGCNTTILSCNPALTICQEDWSCTPWSNCTEGQQTRLCFDRNACNTFYNKPLEVKTCGLPPLPPMDYTIIIIVVVVLIITSLALILKSRKKKKPSFYEKAMQEEAERSQPQPY